MTRQEHAWEAGRAAWHGLYAALLLLVAVLATAVEDLSTGRTVAVLALLTVAAGSYLLLGAPAFACSGWPAGGRVYVAIAVTVTLVGFAVYPAFAILLFAVYTQLWTLLPYRQAVVAVAVLTVGLGAVSAAVLGAPVSIAVLQTVLTLAGSVLLGTWITRIIQQSVERADVIAELQRTRAELATVSHEAGVLAERERLAREIHDTLAQGFTSVLMLVDLAESDVDTDPAAARRRLAVARDTARQNLAEARSLVAALTPVDLQAAPLPQAVGRLVDRFGGEAGLPATVEVAGEPRPLPANQEVVLLRAAQEALANVRRHAGRCRVAVGLRYGPDGTELTVADDGAGFVPDGTPAAGYGLAGMRRRVEEVGGTLRVRSEPACGTTVRVTVP